MDAQGFALFDTAIGRCAVVWSAAGLIGVQLPEADDARGDDSEQALPRARVSAPPPPPRRRRSRGSPPSSPGRRDDFTTLPLDESGVGAFERAVYREARAIPAGQTSTYGAIATALGDVRESRRVGQALGRNPWPIVIPCHRVTGAGGWMGGFSAPGGRAPS